MFVVCSGMDTNECLSVRLPSRWVRVDIRTTPATIIQEKEIDNHSQPRNSYDHSLSVLQRWDIGSGLPFVTPKTWSVHFVVAGTLVGRHLWRHSIECFQTQQLRQRRKQLQRIETTANGWRILNQFTSIIKEESFIQVWEKQRIQSTTQLRKNW